MITDFDGIPTQKDFDNVWKQLTNNPHCVFLFSSPSSGAKETYGIKALIRIPKCTHQEHTKYFKAFNEEFKIPYWDSSNSDVSRVCYESYDPNCLH